MSETLDLTYLIKNMNPNLMEGEYVFCKVNIDSKKIQELDPVSTFRIGKEYLVVLSKQNADKNRFGYDESYNMVSLKISSKNSEAEFLAVISGVFADQGIPSKVFSGIDTCFLFIPVEKIKDALQLLHDLTVDF